MPSGALGSKLLTDLGVEIPDNITDFAFGVIIAVAGYTLSTMFAIFLHKKSISNPNLKRYEKALWFIFAVAIPYLFIPYSFYPLVFIVASTLAFTLFHKNRDEIIRNNK